ncbi:MAG: hydrogenase accessory protein HypB [Candidatus Neomarinimicrobiota bacterium]|nr:MAG: hydrogenase accessory protein HypB [Candidatus Neomarinimicrobiota bacterium]
MCDTCGCGQPNETVTIRKPGDKAEAVERSSHHHHHGDHAHSHDHGSEHQHGAEKGSRERILAVEKDVLSENNRLAERNRGFLEARQILALNLVSSPGSGKTTIVEETIRRLQNDLPVTVIEGDQQSMQDANRIDATGVPVVQVNTGTGCHLDAQMVYRALKSLDPPAHSLLIIENVGNLVCPALFDLGEAHKVVIISVTEGDDKPHKYPTMFAEADLCLINKTDLLPYVDFDLDRCQSFAREVNHRLNFLTLSARTGEGMDAWITWIREQVH